MVIEGGVVDLVSASPEIHLGNSRISVYIATAMNQKFSLRICCNAYSQSRPSLDSPQIITHLSSESGLLLVSDEILIANSSSGYQESIPLS